MFGLLTAPDPSNVLIYRYLCNQPPPIVIKSTVNIYYYYYSYILLGFNSQWGWWITQPFKMNSSSSSRSSSSSLPNTYLHRFIRKIVVAHRTRIIFYNIQYLKKKSEKLYLKNPLFEGTPFKIIWNCELDLLFKLGYKISSSKLGPECKGGGTNFLE